jgi:glycosyltransferase involved in cell wall biosynthesis
MVRRTARGRRTRARVRILIISWYFPPWNEVAGGRPYSWARHFAQHGHDVTVLTPEKDAQVHGTLNLPLEPMERLRVIETPMRLRRTSVGKKATWATGSIPMAARLGRRHDIVISTHPHGCIHGLGRVARLANPALFWCADYRDLWHDNYFFTEGKPVRRFLLRWVEKALMRPVNLNVTVSEPLAARLRRTHPHVPCAVIYNGFHERDYREAPAADRLRERARAGLPFRVLYTGTLYPGGYQDPEPLFAALAARPWSRPIQVAFYGPCAREPMLRELRDRYRLGGVVELPETHLSRAESLAAQRDADLLLHLGWTDLKNDGWLSGKIFEYMAAGTPVLSVGAPPETALGQLLSDSGSGCAVGRDTAAVVATLDLMVNQGRLCDWYRPDPSRIRRFSREAQAGRLLELLARSMAAARSKESAWNAGPSQ